MRLRGFSFFLYSSTASSFRPNSFSERTAAAAESADIDHYHRVLALLSQHDAELVSLPQSSTRAKLRSGLR